MLPSLCLSAPKTSTSRALRIAGKALTGHLGLLARHNMIFQLKHPWPGKSWELGTLEYWLLFKAVLGISNVNMW